MTKYWYIEVDKIYRVQTTDKCVKTILEKIDAIIFGEGYNYKCEDLWIYDLPKDKIAAFKKKCKKAKIVPELLK